MVKPSRIFCISLPLVGTIATLACLAYIGSAGFKVGDGDVDNKYFALIDASKIKTTVGRDNFRGLPDSNDKSKFKDVFAIYLLNYCSGKKDGKGFKIDYCSNSKTTFDQYRVWNAWGVDITKNQLKENEDEKKTNAKRISLGVKGITYLPKTIRAVYAAAIAMAVFELIFGIIAIWTRWSSFLTALTSILATITLFIGTVMSQVLYATLVRSIEKYDYSDSRRGELDARYGKTVYGVSWLAVAISAATTVCWIFSICCVSTSDRKKTGKGRSLGSKLSDLTRGHQYQKMEGGEQTSGTYVSMDQPGPAPPYSPYPYKGAGQV